MKSLENVQNQKTLTLDSREVAGMMGVNHWEILRKLEGSKDRKGYIGILNDNQMVVANYFIKSSYLDDKKEERPCYLLTKMGCEFLANKFTGEKGILFTAKYVQKFNQMENAIKAPMQELSPQLQLLINMELKQREIEMAITETKQEVQDIRDTMVLDHDSWRKECNTLINKIAKQRGGTGEAYKGVREEVYNLVEQRAGAKLKTRIVNKQDRMRREGTSESKVRQVSQVDVIAEDKRLKEIYIAVVKEMAIKYGA